MPTRNVVLTDHHEALIANLLKSGRYQNASEVLREGLRLIEGRDAEDAAKLEALRRAAQTGAAAIERGDFREFSDPGALKAHLERLADAVLNEPQA
jgi:antitoxin ParD1/3/4